MLTSIKSSTDDHADETHQKESPPSKPLSSSKFNELSTSLAFALTGLVIVYLPDFLGKSLDWKIEGRFLGLGFALVGAILGLLAAEKLTRRSGFGIWAFTVLIGAATAGIMAVIHVYRLPKWSAITLIVVVIMLVIGETYGIISGFTIFFDEHEGTTTDTADSTGGTEESKVATAQNTAEKTLSWYERITLIIAIVSAIATLVAAVEPIVHP